MTSSNRNILRIISEFENLFEGQERKFIDYSKTEYAVGRPIFLEDKNGEIIGAVQIQSYEYRKSHAIGRYKVLKIFSDEDRRQFLDMYQESKTGKLLLDLYA